VSYHKTEYVFLGRPGATAAKKEDLKGKRIAAENGTTSQECLEWLNSKWSSKEYSYFSIETTSRIYDAPRALKDENGPDFIFTAEPYANGWKTRHGDAELYKVPSDINAEFSESGKHYCTELKYRIAVGAGESELSSIIDGVIRQMAAEKKDGAALLEDIIQQAETKFKQRKN
jgi:ABC-type amino acid transport substrate-binding protein